VNEDRSARFARLLLPHLASAYRLARWLVRAHEDAEDVVQDAYLQAHRAFDSLRGEAEARAWLLAIVRHSAYGWLRAHQRLPVHEGFDDALHEGGAHATAAGQTPTDTNPEALLLRREDAARLHAAVDQLPLVFREVLVLREFEGLSYREIAALVGVPNGTVMSRLARARQQLLRCLVDTAPAPPPPVQNV